MTLPAAHMNRQIPRLGQLLDVGLDSSLAQSGALAKAQNRWVALAVIVGMICQRKHDQALGRAKRLALEYGGHDAYAHC